MRLGVKYLPNYDLAAWGPLKYARAGDVGFDLRSAEEGSLVLRPGLITVVPTGVAMHIPDGYEVQLRPRSGLAAQFGVTVVNSPGTVDTFFSGQIKAILTVLGSEPVEIARGDRCVQAVLNRVFTADFVTVDTLPETERGSGGLGATGR